MKKHLLLTAAFLTFAGSLVAAPLDTKGIPADAQGVIHVDYDAQMKSKIGAQIQKLFEQTAAKESGNEIKKFQNRIGFNPATDVSGITIGLFTPAEPGKDPEASIIVRGKFSPEKITAALKEKNIATSSQNGLTTFDGAALANLLIPGFGKGPTDTLQRNAVGGIIDKNTIVFAKNKAAVSKIADSYAGKAKSYAAPATLNPFGKQVGTPILLAYANRNLTPPANEQGMMQFPKSEGLGFAAGESGDNLLLRLNSEFAGENDAQQTQGVLQMMLGFLQMAAGQNVKNPDGTTNAKKVEQAQELQQALSALKINADGKSLNVALNYPAASALKLLKEKAESFNAGKSADSDE